MPAGWDRDRARQQIVDFAKMAAPIAGKHNVTIVIEPLNSKECNIVNTVGEAMTYVRAVGHPNFMCLVNCYHFWVNNDNLEELQPAVHWIKHVHLSDLDRRMNPGNSGDSPYRPFFRALRQGGYDGPLSIEASGFNGTGEMAAKAVEFFNREWAS